MTNPAPANPSSENVISVAVVEDDPDVRTVLGNLISSAPQFRCVGVFGSGEELLKHVLELRPAVTLMDIGLPGISGIHCTRELKVLLPDSLVMMLTVLEDHDAVFDSLAAGASGYLAKTTPPGQLLESIAELNRGGAPMSGPIARRVITTFHKPRAGDAEGPILSRRETQILDLLSRGLLYKEIASDLDISVGTVRTHIGRIYEKLHVRSRSQAVAKVFGLLRPT